MAQAAVEEAERLKREAKMVIPHDHMFLKIELANPTGDAYCPLCRQLAWQKQHDAWQQKEKDHRNEFYTKMDEELSNENACRLTYDLQQKKAWKLPGTKEEKKQKRVFEKKRRKKFDKKRKRLLAKETKRQATWENSDAKYRRHELQRRVYEDREIRHYRRIRSYYLTTIVRFRDRLQTSRFLWQGILDPSHIISTSMMRHHIFDEALDKFFVLHMIACESQVNVDIVNERAEKLRLKTLGTRCQELVRVYDVMVQASEGQLGSRGFTIIVQLEYCPNSNLQKTVIEADRLSEPCSELNVLKWATQVAKAMYHMHYNLYKEDGAEVHGNIKPSNILLTLEKDAKLGDFPFVRTRDLLNLRNTCKEQDVWDFGASFYAIMTKGSSVQLDIKGNLAIPIKNLLRTVPVRFGKCLRDVLDMCLRTNVRKRSNAKEVYEVLHAEMERRRLEKEKREFRLLLLQKVLNLMLDGNDGIITKRLFFQRLKDKNDLRYASILNQDEFLAPILNTIKFEPIVKRMKTAVEGSINTSEVLDLMDQVDQTRKREAAAKEREDKLKEHFNMKAADAGVAIGKYGETTY
eukprot:g908.t1